MTSAATSPVRIVWERGLCRHGCQQPLANPRNQFINGHGSKLLDILVDAHRAGRVVSVEDHVGEAVAEYSARGWAVHSFTLRGVAWFDWLVSHREGERPTAAQIDEVIAQLPDSSVEEVLTVPRSGPIPAADETVPPFDAATLAESLEQMGRGEGSVRVPRDSVLDDLETVREIVSRAVVGGMETEEAAVVDRLQARVEELTTEVARVRSEAAAEAMAAEHEAALAVDAVERDAQHRIEALVDRSRIEVGRLRQELAEALAQQAPIQVDLADLSGVSDQVILRLARERAIRSAQVLQRARLEGDAGEVVDLTTVFRGDFVHAARVAAAVELLGGRR